MRAYSQVRPVVPAVAEWQQIPFKKSIVGWHELASHAILHALPPHHSPNALRLAFWAGHIPLRAVRYGQQIVFDRANANAWLKRGGYQPRRCKR